MKKLVLFFSIVFALYIWALIKEKNLEPNRTNRWRGGLNAERQIIKLTNHMVVWNQPDVSL